MENIFNTFIDEDNLKGSKSNVSNDRLFTFGLNTGFIKKWEFSSNGGFDGGQPAILIEFSKDLSEKAFQRVLFREEVRMRIGNEELSPESEEYKEERKKSLQGTISAVYHFLSALGVQKEEIKKLLNGTKLNSFSEWAKAIRVLLPINFMEIKVDLFLEWQYFLKKGKDRTYLQVPLNLKGGVVIVPHIEPVGEWKEIRTEGGLKYKDDEGNEHPIKRNANFMKSNKAIQQFYKEEKSKETSTNDTGWI